MKETIENVADIDFIVVTTATVDKLFSINPDALTLYIFYIKTSKWQKTNQVFSTNTYGMKCLSWGKPRYITARRVLEDNGLVNVIVKRNDKGRIAGYYIKINHLFKEETIQRVSKPPVVLTASGSQETYALSNNNDILKVITLPEANASDPLIETKKSKYSVEENKLFGEVASLWKKMAVVSLGVSEKDVVTDKLFFTIRSTYTKEKWDKADFKELFKYWFADEGMRREKKLSYSLCLSSTYISQYKLSKKIKQRSNASISGDIKL